MEVVTQNRYCSYFSSTNKNSINHLNGLYCFYCLLLPIKKGVSFGRFRAFEKRLGFAGLLGSVGEEGLGVFFPIRKLFFLISVVSTSVVSTSVVSTLGVQILVVQISATLKRSSLPF
jgi:hypothetical protein